MTLGVASQPQRALLPPLSPPQLLSASAGGQWGERHSRQDTQHRPHRQESPPERERNGFDSGRSQRPPGAHAIPSEGGG